MSIVAKESTVKITHCNDILSGRGRGIDNTPGNLKYRELIRSLKTDCIHAPIKEKIHFATRIYSEVKSWDPPARFLKKKPKTNLWVELSKHAAILKIRQALREGAPEIKKSKKVANKSRILPSSMSSSPNHGDPVDKNETNKLADVCPDIGEPSGSPSDSDSSISAPESVALLQHLQNVLDSSEDKTCVDENNEVGQHDSAIESEFSMVQESTPDFTIYLGQLPQKSQPNNSAVGKHFVDIVTIRKDEIVDENKRPCDETLSTFTLMSGVSSMSKKWTDEDWDLFSDDTSSVA